jgi:hypothetical protein
MDIERRTRPELLEEIRRLRRWIHRLTPGSPSGDSPELEERDRVSELARILDESLNEIYIFDCERLNFLRVNRGARESLRYSMPELSALTPLDLKPEFTPGSFAELFRPLREGVVEMERFAYTTSHDLESHLITIKGFLDLLGGAGSGSTFRVSLPPAESRA